MYCCGVKAVSITYSECVFVTLVIHHALRCVIPVVCVTNEREENVVNQHNKFRKMLYSNDENYMFWPVMAIVRFLQRLRRVYISV